MTVGAVFNRAWMDCARGFIFSPRAFFCLPPAPVSVVQDRLILPIRARVLPNYGRRGL